MEICAVAARQQTGFKSIIDNTTLKIGQENLFHPGNTIANIL
jgi:hypothetical protein